MRGREQAIRAEKIGAILDLAFMALVWVGPVVFLGWAFASVPADRERQKTLFMSECTKGASYIACKAKWDGTP